MVTLEQIKEAMRSIEIIDGDASASQHIDDAIEALKTAGDAMNTLAVRGRHDVDALLGCMMGIDIIIGGKDGRQSN